MTASGGQKEDLPSGSQMDEKGSASKQERKVEGVGPDSNFTRPMPSVPCPNTKGMEKTMKMMTSNTPREFRANGSAAAVSQVNHQRDHLITVENLAQQLKAKLDTKAKLLAQLSSSSRSVVTSLGGEDKDLGKKN